MIEPVIAEHIEVTPGVCGGKPRIAGRRIRVQDVVVWHEQLGLSPDEIVSEYPQITLADVHAALAYYYDHREEIRRQMDEDEDRAAALRAVVPSRVLQKLTGTDAATTPLPPG
jgi:uncharacterized protein (DUF433 family)